MCSMRMRAVTSVPPPAGNGTIMVIGREGNGWEEATSVPASVATSATAEKKFFMRPRKTNRDWLFRCSLAVITHAALKKFTGNRYARRWQLTTGKLHQFPGPPKGVRHGGLWLEATNL